MGRAKTILQSEFPYNISARCINRDWFSIDMDTVWKIFCEELTRTSRDHELKIHSFVLMHNHFHLIASTPDSNISQCMHQFMTNSSRRIVKAGNRINETFAGRHFKCILQHSSYYLNAYKYNYRNPVVAGICSRVEGYPYSTLHSLLGLSELRIPVVTDDTLNCDRICTLDWLNTPSEKKLLEVLRCAFKHPQFKSRLCRKTRKPLIGQGHLL
jgi:putative transposase